MENPYANNDEERFDESPKETIVNLPSHRFENSSPLDAKYDTFSFYCPSIVKKVSII